MKLKKLTGLLSSLEGISLTEESANKQMKVTLSTLCKITHLRRCVNLYSQTAGMEEQN